jgi:2',3'-cyclic-nucleotide 2'-phosphodiesterase (5'-nucleotidase family)
VDVVRGGIPIRIIGLTTSEYYFQYSVLPGKILPPAPVAEAQGLLAKKAGKELVIALTHLGTSQDSTVARNTTAIDVIIGGHTHTKLTEVKWTKNKDKKNIPIVQAWAHGLAVGTLLLDVKEGGGVSVVEYKLHEVGPEVAPDPAMTAFIENASPRRNANLAFPADEVLGETKTSLSGYLNGKPVLRSSCWGRHMATAARQAAGASVGIHVSHFEGMWKPAGPVTYADLANEFPHFRKFGDQGWEIATVTMSGIKLRAMMYYISRKGYGVTFSGLGYIALDELDDKAIYRIAIPAEVALAIKTSIPGYRHYLQGLKYTGKYYWTAMAEYIRKNSPLTCR